MASIAKRTTNTGQPKYDVRYRDPTGRQRKKAFSRRADADRFARTVEVEKETGRYVDPTAGKITFGEYAERWLQHRPNLRPRTVSSYRSILRNHLSGTLGDTPITFLTPTQVREWWAAMHYGNLSPATCAKAYRLLRSILNTAVDDELIPKNPCRIKGAGTEASPERPTASADQVWALAEEMPDHLCCAVLLMGFVGLRVGEVLGLERRHVNEMHKRLTVEQQELELDDGQVITAPPKTAAGVRTIALPDPVLHQLDLHLKYHVGPTGESRLFTGTRGGTLRRRRLRDRWLHARSRVEGLPSGFTMHDLRHTANTITAAHGASTAELMARLGHSSPAAAIRYQHATVERDQALAKAVARRSTLGDRPQPYRVCHRCAIQIPPDTGNQVGAEGLEPPTPSL